MERLRRVLPTPSFLLPLSFLLLLTEAFVPATLSPPSNALAARRGSFVATPSRASVGTDLGASDGFSGNGGIPPPLTNTGDPFAILGIDRVDMLMLRDSPDPAVIQAQWAVLEEALAAGRTRSVGVINYCEGALAAVLETAKVKPALNYYMLHVGMGLWGNFTSALVKGPS